MQIIRIPTKAQQERNALRKAKQQQKDDRRNARIEKNHFKAKQAYERDEAYIGTRRYKGLAYFWNKEYKHHLREATNNERQKIHNEFLLNNLCLSDTSDAHLTIINDTVSFD